MPAFLAPALLAPALLLPLLLAPAGPAPAEAAGANPSARDLAFPPLEFHPPKPERVALPNGMVVWFLRDPELPLVRATAYIRTGRVLEPAGKTGLASMTLQLLRSGGTERVAADALNDTLEFLAASIETGAADVVGTASLNVLRKDLDTGLRLFADVLRRPAFEKEKTETLRGQLLESIRRQNDTPRGIALREFGRLVYGADHPLARVPTVESVSGITKADLLDFHRKTVAPARIRLAVSGDLTREEAIAGLTRYFGDWKGAPDEAFRIPAPAPSPAGPYLVTKEINQTSVRVGHPGFLHEDPDFFPMSVLNTAFGGVGFSSRLWKEVRSNRGLAYSVGSDAGVGAFAPGAFAVTCETKAGSTVEAITVLREMIRELTETPIPEAELGRAKDILLNDYVFNFESSASVAAQRARFEYNGYPDDYLESYPDRVRAVTVQQTFEAARRRLQPDGLRILAVGDPARFDRPLDTFGPVTEIRLAEPAPAPPAGGATPGK